MALLFNGEMRALNQLACHTFLRALQERMTLDKMGVMNQ